MPPAGPPPPSVRPDLRPRAASAPLLALHSSTPASWAERTAARLPELLGDHAACELQAAVFALALVGSYAPDAFSSTGSRLWRPRSSGTSGRSLARPAASAGRSRPVGGTPTSTALRKACRSGREPEQGLDLLLVGALVEARSHERLAALAPFLPDPRLVLLYGELAADEARHGARLRRAGGPPRRGGADEGQAGGPPRDRGRRPRRRPDDGRRDPLRAVSPEV